MVNCQAEPEKAMVDETETQAINQVSFPENRSVEFVTGQFEFEDHPDFVRVADSLSDKEIYLQKPTYEAFLDMAAHAEADGVELIVISGTRNFMVQKFIWDRKWENSEEETGMAKARDILLYSSMPMTSRHHWGTDIDLNNLTNSWFKEGEGKIVYDWLTTHANDYGFYQPYTDKSLNGRNGYEEERWHWTYMPLADHYLEFYNQNITNEDITGFEGSDLAPQIDMVANYVNGVSVKVKNY
ncbi:M15 family metallopeptidase [Rhodohalobacter sp. 8-1]|uniref:M15 family metallopeptidase n=1 Tax=Rhodohalobacter sp. 8-1 TaxID=3131972 RepID=UPI0030EF658D